MAVIRADHATVSLGFIQSKAFARDPVSVPIEPMRVAGTSGFVERLRLLPGAEFRAIRVKT